MNRKLKIILLGIACAATWSVADADVAFHGYGQTVVGTTLSNKLSGSAINSANGSYAVFPNVNYTADPSFQPESNFALQVSAPLSDSISAGAQILAKGVDDFKPTFQWAYIKFQLNDTFAFKAGRLQLPLYLFSDFFFVGEAYPWVVPPQAVYITQLTHYDGINLSAQTSVGDWYFYSQFYYGATNVNVTSPAKTVGQTELIASQSQNTTGIALDAGYRDWMTLHAAFEVSKASFCCSSNIQPLVDDLYKNGLNEAASDLDTKNDLTSYWTTGIQLTPGKWMILAEYAGLAAPKTWIPQTESEYISIGRHFGRLMPMFTYGHRNQWMSTKALDSIPPGAVPFDVLEMNVFAEAPAIRAKDNYYGMTLRYDLTSTVALKLDFTRYISNYHVPSDVAPLLHIADVPDPNDANRLSAAVTFTF